jgi:hypothetical protein
MKDRDLTRISTPGGMIMARTPAPLLTPLVTLLLASAALAAVPTVIDDDGPRDGSRTLVLRERWRVGGDDGEVLFGRIVDVKMHRDGTVYVLDNQLCHVVAIGPDGEPLGEISREGEGPGELRQPMRLVLMPDDVLAVGMGYPGKLVLLERDGTPRGSLFPVGRPTDGHIAIMLDVQYRAGVLVVSGGRLVLDAARDSHVERFLAVTDPACTATSRVLETRTPIDPTGRIFDEAADYACDRNWALGPDGEIYVPLSRDRYEVTVLDRDGNETLRFGRDQRPRRRTEAERDAVTPQINAAHAPASQRQWTICEHDPSIERIVCREDGTVWVLTPHGNADQPDGILETWDVFSREGEFLEQVALPALGGIREGATYFGADDRLVVVRGAGSSFHSDEVADEEVEPLEVICYEVGEPEPGGYPVAATRSASGR